MSFETIEIKMAAVSATAPKHLIFEFAHHQNFLTFYFYLTALELFWKLVLVVHRSPFCNFKELLVDAQ